MAEDTTVANKSIQEIMNKQLDRTVDPYIVQTGILGNASGSWAKVRVSASGAISNDDAANFRVSSLGTNADAGQFLVSAKQGDAGLLRVSSFFVSLDTTNSVEKVEQQFTYYYMSAAGIQTVKSTPGLLHSIVINTRGTGSTLKIYDNTSAASGLQIGNLDTTVSLGTFDYDTKFTTGLTVSAAGTGQADMTISYR